ncbi:MAG: ATP-binding protein [Candidatus Limnocylindrales bacterium]
MRTLPTGTVTFIFTDIEGSTRLEHRLGGGYVAVLERQQTLVREAVARHDGDEVSTEGDAFFLVFRDPLAALATCLDVQRALAAEPWPDDAAVRVRMGAHTGQGSLGADNYVGLDVNRAARIAAAAHGGQVLVSGTTSALLEGRLPDGVMLLDLGEHQLKDLVEPVRLAQVSAGGLAADFPPPRTLTAASHLPAQLSSFVGRDTEVAAVHALLSANRLVSLTGPGGTGKTRLGLAVAEAAKPDFVDGVHFVPLATITDRALVVPSIAGTLGLREQADQPIVETLREHLRGRQLLLVLDNFEQVADAAALVGELLVAAPRVKGLVTTRGALRVQGEQEYPVPPLPVPLDGRDHDPEIVTGFAAVQLFVERARSVRPDFAVTDDNAAAVAEICRRLDGLPLAIELAAARLRLLSPQAILERLGKSLDLLASGSRDLPERQRTLRGAIAWSYDLLDERERALFRRLAVFVGGGSFEAIEAICRPIDDLGLDLLEGLESLGDKSLVQIDSSSAEPRVGMLATIREFAAEHLAADPAADEVRCRHAAWFRDLAQRNEPALTSGTSREAIGRLERDDDNLRAALRWSLDRGPIDDGLLTAAALWRFWHLAGRLDEGRSWFTALLERADGVGSASPAALFAALTGAAGIVYWQRDFAAAEALYERSRVTAVETGDKRSIAEAESNLSYTAGQLGRYDEAWARSEHARALMQELGDRLGVAIQEIALGFIANGMGDFERAREQISMATAEFAALGDQYRERDGMLLMGAIELRSGNEPAARRAIGTVLAMNERAIDITGDAVVADFASQFAQRAGRNREAARLTGAAMAMRTRAGGGLDLTTLGIERPVDVLRRVLPDDELALGLAEGLAMGRDAALAAARTEIETQPQ